MRRLKKKTWSDHVSVTDSQCSTYEAPTPRVNVLGSNLLHYRVFSTTYGFVLVIHDSSGGAAVKLGTENRKQRKPGGRRASKRPVIPLSKLEHAEEAKCYLDQKSLTRTRNEPKADAQPSTEKQLTFN